MTDRRFSEEEAKAIFQRAADAQQSGRHGLSPSEGMTLAELQSIGTDVGIPPELVAQAARSLQPAGTSATRTFLGVPIGVGRTVDLGRRLTEAEWERLVVDLRETFDARGAVRTDGSFRQWTNGNLQALLEPTAIGHRLRLRTHKADVRALTAAGSAGIAMAAAMAISATLAGRLTDPAFFMKVGLVAAMGAGALALGAFRLRGWARLRTRQMEGVAERLTLATLEADSKAGRAGD